MYGLQFAALCEIIVEYVGYTSSFDSFEAYSSSHVALLNLDLASVIHHAICTKIRLEN